MAKKDEKVLNALENGTGVILSIKKKADFYKKCTRAATFIMVISGTAIPVVLANHGLIDDNISKLVASIAGAVTAIIPTIIGLEKPHERWKMYRRYHRILDNERMYFENNIDPYDGTAEEREKLYLKKIGELQIRLHEEWEGIVVSSTDMKGGLNGAR